MEAEHGKHWGVNASPWITFVLLLRPPVLMHTRCLLEVEAELQWQSQTQTHQDSGCSLCLSLCCSTDLVPSILLPAQP